MLFDLSEDFLIKQELDKNKCCFVLNFQSVCFCQNFLVWSRKWASVDLILQWIVNKTNREEKLSGWIHLVHPYISNSKKMFAFERKYFLTRMQNIFF